MCIKMRIWRDNPWENAIECLYNRITDRLSLFLCCSADGNYEVRYKCNVLIYPNGEVLWVPPAIYLVSQTKNRPNFRIYSVCPYFRNKLLKSWPSLLCTAEVQVYKHGQRRNCCKDFTSCTSSTWYLFLMMCKTYHHVKQIKPLSIMCLMNPCCLFPK